MLLSVVAAAVVHLLEAWLARPGLVVLLPFLGAQLALIAAAWRLRGLGSSPLRGLGLRTVKLSVAMTAVITPLFTLSMLLDVSGLGTRQSVLHDSPLEPVVVLALFGVSLVYPAVLLRHLLAPTESRWDVPAEVRRASRSNALAIDVHLVLSTAWLATHVELAVGPSAVVSVVATTALFTVIALPRFAIVASRFEGLAFASALLFVLSRVVHTLF